MTTAKELEAMPVSGYGVHNVQTMFGDARVIRHAENRWSVRLDIGGIVYAKSARRAAHYVNQINARSGPWKDAS